MKRFVLSRFDIDITFYHNGKLLLRCPASGSEYQIRISSVMGNNFYKTAWKIDRRIGDLQLWGWLGGMPVARSQSDRQYLYLNNRIIRDKHINHAIRKVLDNIIPDARYPSYVLHLFMDPSTVDVNVHPTKQEVRFKQQRNIHDFVYAVLSDAIKQGIPEQANLNINKDNVLSTRYFPDNREDNLIKDLKTLYSFKNEDSGNANTVNPLGIPIVVLHDYYVLTRYGDDIRIIDYKQLRRHYLYSILLEQLKDSKVIKRPLLVPVMLTFKESLMTEIFAHKDLLDRLGITITEAGPQTMSVRSIPSLLPDLDINTFFSKNSKLWRQQNADIDSVENNCLSAMVDVVCTDAYRQYSLKEIQQALPLMVDLDLPYAEKKYPSIWNTISVTELIGLIHAGN